MGFTVRQMAGSDVAAVAGLAEEGFSNAYQFDWQLNAKALLDAASTGRAFVAVAEMESQVIGYCNLRNWPAGGWVDQIAVTKGQQRRGVGGALLEAVLKAAQERGFWKVSLITSETDRGAMAFFKASGWEAVGKMRDEITKGVNGILLSHIVDYQLHPNR